MDDTRNDTTGGVVGDGSSYGAASLPSTQVNIGANYEASALMERTADMMPHSLMESGGQERSSMESEPLINSQGLCGDEPVARPLSALCVFCCLKLDLRILASSQ